MLSPTKRAFLVSHLGEAKTREIEGDLEGLNLALMSAGIAFKDLDTLTSFDALDTSKTLEEFGFIVGEIVRSEEASERKIELLEQAVAALPRRLGAADKEIASYIKGSADAALGQLTRLVDGAKDVPPADDVTGALAERVKAVIDDEGNRRPVAGASMMLYGAARATTPLGRLWASLGLTGADVAAQLRRKRGKEFGTTQVRISQLAIGSKEDQGRVLEAVQRAAKAAGRGEAEISEATAEIVRTPTSPAEQYVADWLTG